MIPSAVTPCWQRYNRDSTEPERHRNEPHFAKFFVRSCSLAATPAVGFIADAPAAGDRNLASATTNAV